MAASELDSIAEAMVAKDKGILAADESSGTIKKRFDKIKIESTEENRRTYRELLFTTPGASDYISGVILYDETIRQKTRDGVGFADYLTRNGVIPGIKVDIGAKPMAGFPGETITEGLDGSARAAGRVPQAGCALCQVARRDRHRRRDSDAGLHRCERARARALRGVCARKRGIVPIVEPEVLMDGAHSLERCEEVTDRTLQSVFDQLLHAPHPTRRHDPQAEHGDFGNEGGEARRRGRSC